MMKGSGVCVCSGIGILEMKRKFGKSERRCYFIDEVLGFVFLFFRIKKAIEGIFILVFFFWLFFY